MTRSFSEIFKPRAGFAPDQVIDCGDYNLRLKVNPRARRISLRLDSRTGEVVVTAPRPRLLGDAVAFARSRHDWILKTRRAPPPVQSFAPGLRLDIKGHSVVLAESAGVITPRPVQDVDGGWRLVSSGDAKTYAKRIERYLRQQALKAFQTQTDLYAAKLGVSGVKVTLFDAKARWGSCTPGRKAIRYSWRVILAPYEVLTYLAAHEVGHLKHPDHSPAFWATVSELYGGDYRQARQWLKEQGHSLFRYM
ncbi:SprT family zinc-dependent metalloprotease [Asticcacaulis sp. EMRT-3]|uniref:M48 family metallopeptidase n=1 Tax=Asticcacaulis sp. EMRT-3 TaxID=3040349 RepID=UPI0024AF2E8D|nr:SprT family zinc-dependent metalloprotease [Asticcacaulis sp. EMRT-3]MDI7775970.1 SprT family zinc-dependent metalloprotease [Asticcacaulis sp. EMRT-3]